MNARTPCGSPSVTLAPRLVGRQSGATLVFTALFTLAVAAAAFSVFGLGQSIWQRENMQRIADLSAKAAASEIDSAAAGFPAARSYATRNGFNANTDSLTINCNVRGTNTLLQPANCQQTVLVTLSRTIPTLFMGNRTQRVVAEATVQPFISGVLSTNLLTLNTGSGSLSPLFAALGTRLNINAVSFQSLLNSDVQVDLLQLGVKLGVLTNTTTLNTQTLLNGSVNARQLLNAALSVAGTQAPPVTLPVGGELSTVTFPVSRILTVPSAGAGDLTGATVRLGDLAYAATLAAATGIPAGVLQVNAGSLLRISILQPPQLFVARKTAQSGAVLATARTEQVRVSSQILNLLDVTVTSGGGRADIKDIECRLPQSDSAVFADLSSTPLTASISVPSVLGLSTNLSSVSASNLELRGYPDPSLTRSYSFESQQGLGQLATNLNASVLGLSLPLLLLNAPLKAALGQLGGVLDTALDVIGLDVNRVVLQVNGMDCFNTAVLTR